MGVGSAKCEVIGPANIPADWSSLMELKDVIRVDVPANGSLKALVQETLQKAGNWHVVHYAGHTHYDAQNQMGYVFFPCAGEINNIEPVRIAQFALWLEMADTRFVFLSSCKSAGQDFIYQLAKGRVPAIMGFLWEVGDAPAREYATSFYQCLLEGQQDLLEYACLAAKKQVHANYPASPIWASPVLVMQVSV